jgi:hypothetical protein
VLQILCETSDPETVIELEQHWMDRYKIWGGLYNSSPAAGSTLGYEFSSESKIKISEKAKLRASDPKERARLREMAQTQKLEPGWREQQAKAVKAWFADPENKAGFSERARQRSSTPEAKANMRERANRAWKERRPEMLVAMNAPERRAKISKASSERQTPERRKAMSEFSNQLWSDFDHRIKMVEKTKLRWSDPEFRAAQKAIRSDPEWKARASQKSKDMWAKRRLK